MAKVQIEIPDHTLLLFYTTALYSPYSPYSIFSSLDDYNRVLLKLNEESSRDSENEEEDEDESSDEEDEDSSKYINATHTDVSAKMKCFNLSFLIRKWPPTQL